MFDGTLGQWQDKSYYIELRDNVKPYHAKPFPIPHVHEHTLCIEIARLCQIDMLK